MARLIHPARSARLGLEPLDARELPSATVLDLTTRGAEGMINGALFCQDDTQPTGSGVIHSFLRVQGAAAHSQIQQGYNTDARPLQFDENKSPTFTHSLHLSDLPRAYVNGTFYRVFLLDINQKSSQPYLSLDGLRLYVADAPNLTGYNVTDKTLAGRAAVWDMDPAGDGNWVKLDYRLNHGSGSGDMLLYVPEVVFAGAGTDPYVYMYSQFGQYFAGNAGFQEWAPGQRTATASISGTVTDAFGAPLSNQVVFIDQNNDGVLGADEVYTITDANGHFTFADLPASGSPDAAFHIRQITQDGRVSEAIDVFLEPGQDFTGLTFVDDSFIRPT
jgi:Carboxypeptidase regulatory-like domain